MPAEGPDRALGASYTLLEPIGRGAAGQVWRGVDRRTDETIAAKLLRSEYVEDHELVGRFLRERSILVGLRHPNIVAVRDLVAEGDRLAIVMEYVGPGSGRADRNDGGSLRAALSSGPLAAGLALRVTTGVLDGLTLAHERRILHRDVKPDNILLAPNWRTTAPLGVKLSDFGVAALLEDRRSTTTGLIGTPEYMAPEQLLTGVPDFPVDIYAAGVLLYELLAGRTPFAGPGTGYVVAHRHVTSLPPRLPVPDALWDVVERLLDKDPGGRPTAREAATLLRSLPEEVTTLPALEGQQPPAAFAAAGGPATELRGLERPGGPETDPTPNGGQSGAASGGTSGAEDGLDETAATDPAGGPTAPADGGRPPALPDLGVPAGETMLRSMPVVPLGPETGPEQAPARRSGVRAVGERIRALPWRSPQAVAVLVAVALAIGVGVFFLARLGPAPTTGPTAGPSAASAQQQSTGRPSGLGVSRTAAWDPADQTVRLTITYAAQRAPLRGPFLEVLPGVDGSAGCPSVSWESTKAQRNLSSSTGISTPCAWSVEPSAVPARGSTTASATIALGSLGGDPTAALQTWLQKAAEATDTAVEDSETTSTAYPAQRLTDVQVVAPSRTVSGRTLRIALLPVWPSGADQLNPLLISPPSGPPTQALLAAAGGTSGVRFSDGCSGALAVSEDGLVVSAQSVADSCQVNATVGNFTDLTSNSFAITTRGS